MRERLSNFIWGTISRGIGVAITIGVVYAFAALMEKAPMWIGGIAPAVVIDKVTVISRVDDYACFALSLRKVGAGTPQFPVFHVEAISGAYSPPIGIAAHRIDEDGNRDDRPLREHPIGDVWQSRYCFNMPGTISLHDSVAVSGYLVHARWGWVTVQEPIPTFVVAAQEK